MLFIDEIGNYPLYKGDLITLLGDWDFGQPIPEGWHEVGVLDMPEAPEGFIAVHKEELDWIDGKPFQGWVVIEKPEPPIEIIDETIGEIDAPAV